MNKTKNKKEKNSASALYTLLVHRLLHSLEYNYKYIAYIHNITIYLRISQFILFTL